MTAQILTFTPRDISYSPPRHSDAERLGDMWRIIGADIAEDCFWIGTYYRALAKADMTETYRRHIEKALASRIRTYLAGLRQVYEIEQRMEREGVTFRKAGQW